MVRTWKDEWNSDNATEDMLDVHLVPSSGDGQQAVLEGVRVGYSS